MQVGNFKVEVALKEDENSWHGAVVDFHKSLSRFISDYYCTIGYIVTNEENGDVYPNSAKKLDVHS
jgi:hypothetical protein